MKANNEEITEVETDEWYMRRMNAGLAHLQDICYCLAWLIMEDDGVSLLCACLIVWCGHVPLLKICHWVVRCKAQAHARMLLDRRGRSFKEISAILKGLFPFLSPRVHCSLCLTADVHFSFRCLEMRDVIAADVDLPQDDSEEAGPNMDDPAVQKTLILDALTQFLDGI
jgi:hypothetical protein